MLRLEIKPAVSSAVAYGYMRYQQWSCVKQSGQSSPFERRSQSREAETTLQVSCGWGARLNGMNNKSELLINIVTLNKPKILTGLTQKGRSRIIPSRLGLHEQQNCRWNRQILTHSFVTYAEHGKPVFLLSNSGQRAVRQAYGSAGIGLQKKRTPLCNGADRGLNVTLLRKQADFCVR